MWAQNMEVFFRTINCGALSLVTSLLPKQDGESLAIFACLLEDWNSIHYKIMSWFINSFVPSIDSLLPRLGNAKFAWDFLAKRYNCTHGDSL